MKKVLDKWFDTWIDFVQYMNNGSFFDIVIGTLVYLVPILLACAVIAVVCAGLLYLAIQIPLYIILTAVVVSVTGRLLFKIYKFKKS